MNKSKPPQPVTTQTAQTLQHSVSNSTSSNTLQSIQLRTEELDRIGSIKATQIGNIVVQATNKPGQTRYQLAEISKRNDSYANDDLKLIDNKSPKQQPNVNMNKSFGENGQDLVGNGSEQLSGNNFIHKSGSDPSLIISSPSKLLKVQAEHLINTNQKR